MKRVLGILGIVLLTWAVSYVQQHQRIIDYAWAGITCALPVTLVNGTTADATQVMQNFNQLSGCFANVATVSSVTCGPGLDGGTITGVGTCSLSAARRTFPTFQRFAGAGTFTYTTPTGTQYIEIWMIGGGGGGAGSSPTGGAGGNGGDTCWGTSGCTTPIFDAGGGGGAPAASNGSAGVGGVATAGSSLCIIQLTGNDGVPFLGESTGSAGGAGPFGGAKFGPFGGTSTSNAATGSGGMGGNAGSASSAGGGAGGYCYALITNPAASYSITVGAGGTAGTAGTGVAGAAGANGSIYVLEHYN